VNHRTGDAYSPAVTHVRGAVRQTTRSPLTRLARGLFITCALALITLALAGTATVEANRRAARSDAARLREYFALTNLAASQRRRLAVTSRSAVQTEAFVVDAGRTSATLRLLQAQSNGPDSNALTELEVSYETALQRAKANRGEASLSRSLAALQTSATQKLAELEAVRRDDPGNSLLERAGIAAMGLIAIANLLYLLRLGMLRLRRPGEWDGRDRRVEELEAQALTDSLTLLGNHRAFHSDLSEELKRRAATGAHFTLMAIDLDGLKHINDTKGHPAGDTHIRGVAKCLKTVLGEDGTIYRTGGDEFMVILPNKRNWDALLLANKVDQVTRQFAGMRAVSVGLTESTGMEGRQLLVHQADLALYEAKRTKLRAVTYHPGLAAGVSNGPSNRGPSRDQRALAAALARAVDAKDIGTRSHSELVAELSVAVGARLGISGDRLERLRLAGLLHDVGKIGVADAILQKTGPLAEDEQLAMAEHVKTGQAILVAAELSTEAAWIFQHHEWYDGTGYPNELSGEEISLEARIISVADAFEAMTGPRPYRESITTDDALAELRDSAGSQFDVRCVDALAAAVQNFPDLVKDARRLPVVLQQAIPDAAFARAG
jgi:diguanylate cyclase (GGDEF)-like protein